MGLTWQELALKSRDPNAVLGGPLRIRVTKKLAGERPRLLVKLLANATLEPGLEPEAAG
jgi:hypothetical protein